jgi:carboxyl-terminal processing protease
MRRSFQLFVALAGALGASASDTPLPPDDRPPAIALQRPPYYPFESRLAGIEGTVVLDVLVNRDGSVNQARATSYPDPFLRDAAIAAVLRWKFRPGLRDGLPVEMHLRVPVTFTLDKAEALRGSRVEEPPLVPPPAPADAAPGAERRDADAFAEARTLAEAGQDLAAAAKLDLCLKSRPEFVDAYLLRARVLARKGYVEEARDDLATARSIDPDNAAIAPALNALAPPARVPGAGPDWSERRYLSFKLVWDTVERAYFDSTFGGVDWTAVRWKYRGQLPAAANNEQLRRLLQDMLGELHRTHFAILPRDAAVFNPSERTRIGSAGARVEPIDGRIAVQAVDPGSPASKAGLTPGDAVVSVDGTAIDPLFAQLARAGYTGAKAATYVTDFVDTRLNGPEGAAVKLDLEDLDGRRRTALVTCGPSQGEWSEPYGHFPSYPIRFDAHREEDGIAVVSFNVFALPAMRRFRSFCAELRPGDGLILDLRGNQGGVTAIASGICGLLCASRGSLGTLHLREGQASLEYHPQPVVFSGPVAILIDGRSASTSEILAAGLKEAHRARVFGERSAGAALPSVFAALPNGDLFQYAVADLKTPGGTLIEGSGVVPEVEVKTTRADLASGWDPVFAAARAWLMYARDAGAGSP